MVPQVEQVVLAQAQVPQVEQMGLAQAWCEQVAGLPDDDDEKLEAASLVLDHRPPSFRPQPKSLACRHLATLRTR